MGNGKLIAFQEIPEFHLSATLHVVSYPSQSLTVKGYFAVPDGDGPFSLIIYCRGGLRNVGMTKLAWIDHFVSRGFAVFAPFYRGNRGGEGREDFGGDDRFDVIDALPWLKQLRQVDPERMHVFGFSRGSIPALYTAMQCPEIRSAAVWGGISDLTFTYEERVDLRRMLRRVIGGPPWKVPEAYARRSPARDADLLTRPTLIIHGKRDRLVGVRHAYHLAEALRKAGKKIELWVEEDEGHLFSLEKQWATMDRMLEWMRQWEPRKR